MLLNFIKRHRPNKYYYLYTECAVSPNYHTTATERELEDTVEAVVLYQNSTAKKVGKKLRGLPLGMVKTGRIVSVSKVRFDNDNEAMNFLENINNYHDTKHPELNLRSKIFPPTYAESLSDFIR